MSTLFTPLTLPCGLELANRVCLAPLTNTQSHLDGTLSDDELEWLRARARGGFGWISTCAAYVSDEGKAWKGQLGIANDSHDAGLARLAEALHAEGTRCGVQLHHAGLKADECPGPKLAPMASEDGSVRAATDADLERVIADYVSAARRAERAGFDGVEIHGANGYLFTQFLSPVQNQRDDKWGGELANRAKLLLDTIRAVRAAVSPGFAVGVRISPVDSWFVLGLTLDDGRSLVPMLGQEGIDMLHLSLPRALCTPPKEDSVQVVTTELRQVLPAAIPLMTVGDIWTREDAEAALDAGADLVALGRSAIGNPTWPQEASREGFSPRRTPFAVEDLEAASVGPAFITYLEKFSGMVVGGKAGRG